MATKKKTSPITNNAVLTLKQNRKFIVQIAVIVVLGLAVFFIAKKYRGMIIAATVDTTPITRWQLNKRMAAQYGDQVLEEIIGETLLLKTAKKEGLTVSQSDIDQEIETIKEQLGGEEGLNQALVQYGMSIEDLKTRLQTSLLQQKLAEKLFGDQVEVTQEEVEQTYESNKEYYTDKTLEEVQEEIAKQLKEQKLQEKFFAWFEEQKTKAQINTYL